MQNGQISKSPTTELEHCATAMGWGLGILAHCMGLGAPGFPMLRLHFYTCTWSCFLQGCSCQASDHQEAPAAVRFQGFSVPCLLPLHTWTLLMAL